MLKLAEVKDISENGARIVLGPNGLEIALFKVNGEIFALNNECPHQGAPLALGYIEDHCVTCPWHAWTFDLKTGECLNMPGEQAACIPIKIEDDSIYLDMP